VCHKCALCKVSLCASERVRDGRAELGRSEMRLVLVLLRVMPDTVPIRASLLTLHAATTKVAGGLDCEVEVILDAGRMAVTYATRLAAFPTGGTCVMEPFSKSSIAFIADAFNSGSSSSTPAFASVDSALAASVRAVRSS
jgi:hypothetical protein